jgi:hypothetical protein
MLVEFLISIGIDYRLILSALVGSMAKIRNSKLDVLSKIHTTLLGLGVSIYLTPICFYYFNVTNIEVKISVVLVFGFFGLDFLEKIQKKLFDWFEKFDPTILKDKP